MRFTKIAYSRTFPLEQFGNHKPFVEIELSENESPLFALNEAKKLVDEFHQQIVSELEARNTVQVTKPQVNKLTVFDEIAKCNTLEELKGWELFANSSKSEDVKLAYSNKLKQLTNEPK